MIIKRNNNKGYSFMELIITLAIFSIVMLAIIMMMRTTLVSYKNGLYETENQEEAQIVVNQICDRIVEATSVTAISGGYKVDTAGGEKEFFLDDDNNTLYCNTELLSDMISKFEISGYNDNNDNVAKVSITVEKNGRSYDVSKDVYFRNIAVETPELYDLSGKSTLDTSSGGATDKSILILRYGLLDLTKEYGIVQLTEASDKANQEYIFRIGSSTDYLLKVDETVDDQKLSTRSDISTKKASDGVGIIIEPNYTNRRNLDFSCEEDEGAYVKGKTTDGTEYTFKLSTEKVTFNENSADVFVNHANTSAERGFNSYIPVTGININNAAKTSSEMQIKYKARLQKTSVTNADFYSGLENISYRSPSTDFSPGGVTIGTDQAIPGSGSGDRHYLKIQVGLLADSNQNGIMVTTRSDAKVGDGQEEHDLYTGAEDGDQFLTFYVYFFDSTGINSLGKSEGYPIEYKYSYVGKSLEKLN